MSERECLRTIMAAWLKQNGYDGLWNPDCGCEVNDLMPCDNPSPACEPGYKSTHDTDGNCPHDTPCLGEGADWCIGAKLDKPTPTPAPEVKP